MLKYITYVICHPNTLNMNLGIDRGAYMVFDSTFYHTIQEKSGSIS